MKRKNHNLSQSDLIDELPLACADERAALELFENQRWGGSPCCVHCGDTNVYTIKDRKTGERRKDGRWRCRGCGKQYTVRVGQIMEDSPIPLRKWAYAFWCAATAKNGVSALEVSRKVQVTYKSALYMMNRIRWAMRPKGPEPKLTGTVEADETWIGPRKPRHRGTAANPVNKRGKGTNKQPVCAVIQRGGEVRTRIVPVVNGSNVREFLADNVDQSARLFTDTEGSYTHVGPMFAAHERVNHRQYEYARGEVSTNSIEGFFARVKRGLTGTFHSVSREHLHRYMDHFEFLHNARHLNDGERIALLVKSADGKRLVYREPESKAG